jgi:hypothetical protein
VKIKDVRLCCCAVGFGQHTLASNITLLRATEVDEILEGNDDKYKALTVSSDVILQRFAIGPLIQYAKKV